MAVLRGIERDARTSARKRQASRPAFWEIGYEKPRCPRCMRGCFRARRIGRIGPDTQHDQAARLAQLRIERHARRVRPAGLARALGRARCRFLQGAGGGDLQRPDQGQVRAADGEGPLHRAAIGRGRCARPQHHLDLVARHLARAELQRRQLLRRPGLHGAEVAQAQFGARTRRRRGLRAAGHHHRIEPRRLFPRQQDEAQDRHLRDRDRGGEGLRRRPLRRLHHRRLRSRRRAAAARPGQRPHHPAGDHLQGAARACGAPRRRPVVRHREVDALRHGQRRGTRHHPSQCRRAEEIGQSGHQASARQRGQAWRGARPDRRLGLSHHQARRQLRRGVRAQRRPGLAAEDRARAERAVEQGRAAIRAVAVR